MSLLEGRHANQQRRGIHHVVISCNSLITDSSLISMAAYRACGIRHRLPTCIKYDAGGRQFGELRNRGL